MDMYPVRKLKTKDLYLNNNQIKRKKASNVPNIPSDCAII